MAAAPSMGTMLGRYQILKPLAKGGMAEVFLARTIGIKGFERHVVIKKLLYEHRQDEKSNNMFLDEARLVAALHHRNIVQVHDVGEENGKYFFVMEYVHGEDVRALLRHVKEAKQQIPLEHIITIVSAAAAGLHHAHEQRGRDGKPLGIVHRDISPGNILIGFDGGVKVVDFGIAKVEQRTTETQAGELKGKLGYMAPEQCKAQPVDRRSDVFLLGIVLYELVTVKRLFKGGRYEVMSAIVEGAVPPPSVIRDIGPELEAIIFKALQVKKEDRYQSADELRVALETYATNAKLQISPARLADYLKQQFGERLEPWLVDEQPPVPDIVEIDPGNVIVSDEALQPEETPPASAPAAEPTGERRSKTLGALIAPEPPAGTTGSFAESETSGETPMAWSVDASGRRKKWILGAGATGLLAAAVIAIVVMSRGGGEREPVTPTKGPVVETRPAPGGNAAPPDPIASRDKPKVDPPAAGSAEPPLAAGSAEPLAAGSGDPPVAAGSGQPTKPAKPVRPTRPVKPAVKPVSPTTDPQPPKPPPKPPTDDGDLDSPFPTGKP